ncbi:MAG: cyclic peptide export ABC transporter [Emcibacteraceae bacterium]|nr:cyclic peptide export ABC transporter [Emcibacteraceae bacterium]
MIFENIRKNKKKIVLISGISAMSGGANILLLKLATSYALRVDEILTAMIYFWWALFLMIVLGFLSQYLLALLGAQITYDIREQLTKSISNFTYEQLESVGTHRLYTTLTEDIAVINNWLGIIPVLVYNATIVLLGLAYLGTMSIGYLLTALGFLTLGILVSKLFIIKRGTAQFGKRRELQDKLFESYRAVIDGFKEFNFNQVRQKKFHKEDLASISTDFKSVSGKAAFYFSLANNWNAGMLFLSVGSVIFISHSFIDLDVSVLNFIVVVFYIMGPIIFLMNSWQNFALASVAINRLKKLKFEQTKVGSTDIEHSDFKMLSLNNIFYKYNNEENSGTFEFGPFDLEIHKGEVVFFVGGNGSGKTTAAKILTGLYEPTIGNISLNNILLSREKMEWYNSYFSTIFSDYYLFNRIISKHGKQIDDNSITYFINKMQLADKVNVKDGELSTIDLSEGQRKRLALLISYFDDAEISVFDEWAAEQDSHFREYFYNEFLMELKCQGKTVIVITHDDRYFHVADKVIKFERGRIVGFNNEECHV